MKIILIVLSFFVLLLIAVWFSYLFAMTICYEISANERIMSTIFGEMDIVNMFVLCMLLPVICNIIMCVWVLCWKIKNRMYGVKLHWT